MNTTFNFFVYGTLQRGGARQGALAGQRFLGAARTRPLYALFDLGPYPALVQCAENGRAIYGELYETAATTIERLDRLEGAPDLYRLEPILLDFPLGDAFAYFYRQSTTGFPLCVENRWPSEDRTHDPR